MGNEGVGKICPTSNDGCEKTHFAAAKLRECFRWSELVPPSCGNAFVAANALPQVFGSISGRIIPVKRSLVTTATGFINRCQQLFTN